MNTMEAHSSGRSVMEDYRNIYNKCETLLPSDKEIVIVNTYTNPIDEPIIVYITFQLKHFVYFSPLFLVLALI